MKFCSSCSTEKKVTEFGLKNKEKKIYQSKCKACQREYAKLHYGNNISYYKEKALRHNKINTETNKQKIIEYLECHPCVDCGETDLDVLEFDHNERQPEYRVTTLLNWSWKRIEQEISECQIRCANCHLKRTRKQLGTSRYGGTVYTQRLERCPSG